MDDAQNVHDKNYATTAAVSEFQENSRRVQEQIKAAAFRIDRDPGAVQLLPVSKTVPVERTRRAITAGTSQLGGNKAQEGYLLMRAPGRCGRAAEIPRASRVRLRGASRFRAVIARHSAL